MQHFPVSVLLTDDEVGMARIIADLREKHHEKMNTKTRYGWDDDADSAAIRFLSLCAEIAAAKLTNSYWPLAYTKPVVPDLEGIEVYYGQKGNYGLLVHWGDTDEVRWLLVVGTPPAMTVVGWAWSSEVREPGHWATDLPRPCYRYRQHELRRDFWWRPSTIPWLGEEAR